MYAFKFWQDYCDPDYRSLKTYHEVLRILVNMLFEKYESEEGERIQKISDLKAQDKVYTLEKALLQMYDYGEFKEILKGTQWEKCTTKSMEDIENRIKAIQCVHNIRNLLATQCYIGVVGHQDAGEKYTFKIQSSTYTNLAK